MITKLTQYVLGLMWLAYIAIGLNSGVCEAQIDIGTVKEAVGLFLQAELDGSGGPVRKNLITFSPHRQAELDRKTEPGVGPFDLDIFDRAFIVKNFSILDCKVGSKSATVTVVYQRTARIENFDTSELRIVAERVDRDVVNLRAVFKKNKWWVLDPPPPRVSKEVLISYYEAETKWYIERQNEFGKLPKFQQDAYDKKSAILRLLKSL